MSEQLDWVVSTKDGVVYGVTDEEAYAAGEAMEKNTVWKCPRLSVLGLAGNMIKMVELAKEYRRRTGSTVGLDTAAMTGDRALPPGDRVAPSTPASRAKIAQIRAELAKNLGWPEAHSGAEFTVDGKEMDVQEVYDLAKSKGYLPSKGVSARAGSVAYLAKQGMRAEEIKA